MTPGGAPRPFPAVAAATALVALAVVAAACSGSSSADEGLPPVTLDPTTTSASSTTTTTVATTTSSSTTTSTPTPTVPGGKPDLEIPTEWDSDLDEIYGRYLLYWDALLIASGPPEAEPNYPPLQDLADPDLYEEVAAQLTASQQAGEVIHDPEDSPTDHGLRLPNPSMLNKVEGNEVVIQDCFINGWVMTSVSGDVLDDTVVAKLYNVDMRVTDGQWLVLAVVEAGPDSSGYQECKDYLD